MKLISNDVYLNNMLINSHSMSKFGDKVNIFSKYKQIFFHSAINQRFPTFFLVYFSSVIFLWNSKARFLRVTFPTPVHFHLGGVLWYSSITFNLYRGFPIESFLVLV